MDTDTEVFEKIFGSRTDADKEVKKQDDDSAILARILEERQVTLDNANLPEEPSAFDRIFTQPGQRFLERGSATAGRIGEQAGLMTQGPSTPVGLTDVQAGTDYPSVLLQTVGNPISLGFDVLANTIMVEQKGLLVYCLMQLKKELWSFLIVLYKLKLVS